MTRAAARIRGLWSELKRRRVVRTGVTYVVSAAGIMGALDAFGEPLHLPAWALTAIAVALLSGFPIVLLLAWLFDISRTGREPAPAEAAPPAPARPRHNFSFPLAPLVGREAELGEAAELLGRPDCRLLTLTGPAGMGKTRLAQEIALRAAATCADGAWFIPLAEVENVEAVPAAIAETLGLALSVREPPLRQLGGFLQEKELLLVLDNFEHLLPAAPVLSQLLGGAARLRLLVTSQRRLRIAGETVLTLDALDVPEPGSALENAAAAVLFLQIAQRNDPRMQLDAEDEAAIGRICRVVGGVPLAIELAAASVGPLSCSDLAAALEQQHSDVLSARRDLPPRHQSLSAAFESSWRLLDAEEQQAFRGISVFRGGFDSESAAAVAGAEIRMIARLGEASLVKRRTTSTYDLLPVLRGFGDEKLREQPAQLAEVQRRHTSHYLGRVAALPRIEPGSAWDAAIEWLAQSSADVRAAWLRAAAEGDHARLRSSAPGLHLLLEERGRSVEGAELFSRAVAATRPLVEHGTAPPGTLARLLSRQASFNIDLGEVSDAAELLAEALPLLRAEGDRAEIAFALSRQCRVLRAQGEYRAPQFEEALALYRELGDRRGIATALNGLGAARHSLGDYEEAKRLYRESAELFRSLGMAADAWPPLNNLAGIAMVQGDLRSARRILESELDTFRQRDNPRALVVLLGNLGLIAYRSGDLRGAVPLLEESVALARRVGNRRQLGYGLNTLAHIRLDHGDLAGAEETYRAALHAGAAAEEAPLIGEIVVGLARVRLRQHDPHGAAVLLRAVESCHTCDEEARTAARGLLQGLHVTPGSSGMTLDTIVQRLLGVQPVGAVPPAR